jgi:uncharacterized protein (DUF924 family)
VSDDDGATPTKEQVLDFWFGELDERGLAAEDKSKSWWKKDPDFDALVEERFGGLIESVCADERESWLDSPEGCIAYVIVLDQFCRNVHRGTPRMYAEDDRALSAAERSVERGFDRMLPLAQRAFLYMPLMHCESREAQARCVALFETMVAEVTGETAERMKGYVDAAHSHRRIVERFGRFPHRNELLGRQTTAEEKAFLEEPGSSF